MGAAKIRTPDASNQRGAKKWKEQGCAAMRQSPTEAAEVSQRGEHCSHSLPVTAPRAARRRAAAAEGGGGRRDITREEQRRVLGHLHGRMVGGSIRASQWRRVATRESLPVVGNRVGPAVAVCQSLVPWTVGFGRVSGLLDWTVL